MQYRAVVKIKLFLLENSNLGFALIFSIHSVSLSKYLPVQHFSFEWMLGRLNEIMHINSWHMISIIISRFSTHTSSLFYPQHLLDRH